MWLLFCFQTQIAASAESIIDLAGQLLVSRIQELAFWNAFPEAFKLSIVEKKSEIVETPPRFSDSQKIETQTLEQDKLEFMVNKPVTLRGISYYKRKGDSKKIKVSLLEVRIRAWNLSKLNTTGTKETVWFREVSGLELFYMYNKYRKLEQDLRTHLV